MPAIPAARRHALDFLVSVDKITGSTADERDHGNGDPCEDLVQHQWVGRDAVLVGAGAHFEAPRAAALGGQRLIHGRHTGFDDDVGGVHLRSILPEAP